MNRNELENDSTVQKLFALISPTPATKETYLTALVHYTDFTGMTPTELIDEGNRDIQDGKLMIDRTVFVRIPQFREYLKTVKTPQANKPLAPGTLNKYVSRINSFYRYFYIEVPKSPRSQKKVKPVKANMKRPSRDDIRTVHSIASLRDKSLMLCGISSGMGAAELSSLTVEAFKEGYDPKTGITTFDMRRGKVEQDFITFITPEASNSVLEYLEWRNRPPSIPIDKRATAEYEKRRVTPDSYLFITNKVNREYLETRNEELRQLVPDTIKQVYNRLSGYSGLRSSKGVYNPIRAHNMRKIFVTTLRNEGCDGDLVRYFVGHTLGGSEDTYFEGDSEKLKIIYQKFVPYLTIQKELDVASSAEYQEIVRENKVLQIESARHIVERGELADMHRKMTRVQKTLDVLIEEVGIEKFKRINAKLQDDINRHVMDEELLGFDWSDVEE